MTKFETILRLAEIRAVMEYREATCSEILINKLIEDLSEEFKEEHDEDCEHECPAFSECPDTTHLYARKVCIGCGHHHD